MSTQTINIYAPEESLAKVDVSKLNTYYITPDGELSAQQTFVAMGSKTSETLDISRIVKYLESPQSIENFIFGIYIDVSLSYNGDVDTYTLVVTKLNTITVKLLDRNQSATGGYIPLAINFKVDYNKYLLSITESVWCHGNSVLHTSGSTNQALFTRDITFYTYGK